MTPIETHETLCRLDLLERKVEFLLELEAGREVLVCPVCQRQDKLGCLNCWGVGFVLRPTDE